MKARIFSYITGVAVVTAMLGAAVPASAQAIITNGSGIALGVNPEGELNVTPSSMPALGASDPANPYTTNGGTPGAVGVALFQDWGSGKPEWRDATSPGCLCEGWGVAVNGTTSGYANVSTDAGAHNLTVDSFTSTSSTADSKVHLTSLPGLTVEQNYHPSTSPQLYEDTVTITNNTGATVNNVQYERVMDWDIPPTEFNEFVTIQGALLGDLEWSNDNGFWTANPLGGNPSDLEPGTTNTNFTDSGPDDHGAYFRFNFGSLADGESKTFSIFYGAAPTEAGALAALTAAGAEGIYSFGQSSTIDGPSLGTPATFIFGFGGVGAPTLGAVPEPTTLLLLGSGLVGLVRARRRKSN